MALSLLIALTLAEFHVLRRNPDDQPTPSKHPDDPATRGEREMPILGRAYGAEWKALSCDELSEHRVRLDIKGVYCDLSNMKCIILIGTSFSLGGANLGTVP
jgi:hypothetical protein